MSLQAANLYATVSVAGADRSVRDLGRVSGATDTAQRRLTVLGRTSGGIGKGLGQMLGGVARIAAITAGALVATAGAATFVGMNMADQFAGIKKTVEGTPEELDALNDALKRLSTRIPVSYQDLAMIATEAGALDVATADVDEFTEAVARTTAATVGLDTALASEAFGKLGTIFNLRGEEYNRLGSALVELGRSGASTEIDIISVTKRFAAAGQQAGLSAAQVLGWSSALASLGPEAEAAGGALQRVFNRATRNISLMNEPGLIGKNAKARVNAFARVAGMTVDEFVALYTRDASGAMQRFMAGLTGMDKFAAQREMFKAGIINQRDLLALQSFTERYPVLVKQLNMSTKAWEENTALMSVSEARFDTLKAKLTELKSTAMLGADAFSEGFLPALGRVADKAKGMILAHMDDFRRFGVEVGAAIDGIDWSRVESGIRTVVVITRGLLGVIKQIPAELSVAFVGLVGLDKLAGGLLGRGAGNVIGGLFNQFLARGASPANPMWVASAQGFGGPAGGKPGGGIPPILPGVALLATLPFVLAGDTPTRAPTGEPISDPERQRRIATIETGLADLRKRNPDELVDASVRGSRTVREAIAEMSAKLDELKGIEAAQDHSYDAIERLRGAVGQAQDSSMTEAEKTRAAMADDKPKSRTSAEAQALYLLSRKLLGHTTPGDPKDRTPSLTPRLDYLRTHTNAGAVTVARALVEHFRRTNLPVYQSAKNQERALVALRGLQQRFIARGDTKNAAIIGREINDLERRIAAAQQKTTAATKKVEFAEHATMEAVRKKDLSVEINPAPVSINIDGKRVASAIFKWMYDASPRFS